MKKLDLSAVTSTIGFPVKNGTFEFLQNAYQELITAVYRAAVERPGNTGPFVLAGCSTNIIGPTLYITAGWIFYNDEIYQTNSAALTITGGLTPVANIVTTNYTTNADPVIFSDLVSRNVHNIRKITFTNGTSGSGSFDFNDVVFTYPIIESRSVMTTDTLDFSRDRTIIYLNPCSTSALTFDSTNAVIGNTIIIQTPISVFTSLTFPSSPTFIYLTSPVGIDIAWTTLNMKITYLGAASGNSYFSLEYFGY